MSKFWSDDVNLPKKNYVGRKQKYILNVFLLSKGQWAIKLIWAGFFFRARIIYDNYDYEKLQISRTTNCFLQVCSRSNCHQEVPFVRLQYLIVMTPSRAGSSHSSSWRIFSSARLGSWPFSLQLRCKIGQKRAENRPKMSQNSILSWRLIFLLIFIII